MVVNNLLSVPLERFKEMGRKINDAEVRKLELEILINFSKYCEKYNLRYFLAYGTLIGAVRHKGFIPWDNDVDVVMPRPDYDRFMELVREERIGEHFHVLDYHDVKTFPFAKVIDNRTRLSEKYLVTDTMGVYIDVFPLDGLPDDVRKRKRLEKKAAIYYKLYAFTNYRFNEGSTKLKKIIKNIMYPFSRIISSRWICEKLNKLCEKYSFDQSKFVTNIVWGYLPSECISKEVFESSDRCEFEGHFFDIPVGGGKWLNRIYGDYMKLPPEEERIIHYFEAEWKD